MFENQSWKNPRHRVEIRLFSLFSSFKIILGIVSKVIENLRSRTIIPYLKNKNLTKE